MDTTTTSTPATPIPVGQRVQIITCLCFVNTLALRARHHCACKDVPGEAQSLDDRSSFPKGKYSPSESESANNTCNTSSRSGADLVNWGPQANIEMGPYTFAHIYLDQPSGSFFFVMLAAAQCAP